MFRLQTASLVLFVLLAFSSAHRLQAQSTVITPGNIGVNDSYYERIGVGFGVNRPGWFFNQGSFNSAVPPFGGFTPGVGGATGFNIGGFSFNFAADSGSDRSITAGAPMLNLMNGVPGSFGVIRQRPFVTGFVPVVGHHGANMHDRVGRWNGGERPDSLSPETPRDPSQPRSQASSDQSTAAQPTSGLAAIRAQLDQESRAQREKYDRLIALAKKAEAEGKTGAARILYDQAKKVQPK